MTEKNKINLRSSSFANYCFGMYTERHIKLFHDLFDLEEEMSSFSQGLMRYGTKHEVHGIAEFSQWIGEIPQFILSEQLNLVVPLDDTISLSSTPDGFCMDGNSLVEIKCTKIKRKAKDSFDMRWLPQVFGQMMVVNKNYELNNIPKCIQQTFLVNWAEKNTKIYRIKPNNDIMLEMLKLLKEYGNALKDMKDTIKNLPTLLDLEEKDKKMIEQQILSKLSSKSDILTNINPLMKEANKSSVSLIYESSTS